MAATTDLHSLMGGRHGTPIRLDLLPCSMRKLPPTWLQSSTTRTSITVQPLSFATTTMFRRASRSLIYLRGTNQVVFYDRSSYRARRINKAIYQTTTGPLTISGNTGSWPTRSGTQEVYFTSLLPSGATIANTPLITSTYSEQTTTIGSPIPLLK